MPTNTAVGFRIAQARANKGYSTGDTARLTGVKEKTIRKWEAGKSTPRANGIQMLAGILGVPLMWLMEGGEQFEQDESSSRQLSLLQGKVDRMAKLQQELLTLSDEIAIEVKDLHQNEKDLELRAE